MSEARKEESFTASEAKRPQLYRVWPEQDGRATQTRSGPTAGLAWARSYRARLRISDTLVISAAGLCALFVQVQLSAAAATTFPRPSQWAMCALTVITWIVVLAAFHTRDHRIVGAGAAEYKQVITACLMAFGLLAMMLFLLDWELPGRFFVLTLPVGAFALLLSRWLWRQWLTRQRRFGHHLSRAVVIGSAENVDYVVARIEERLGAAYAVVGVVLDQDSMKPQSGNTAHPVYFGLDSTAEAAAALGADAVIVAGHPNNATNFIRDLAWKLEGTAAELILASRLTNVAGPRIHFRPVEGLPLIHVEIPQFDGGQYWVKRTMDVVIAGTGLVLLAPLLLVLALLVRIDSPGPALFSQLRVGRDGRRFRMWKFRSMAASAPDRLAELVPANEGAGPMFKLRNDPRVTSLGKVLRKYSLDELPQLWNVLIGDMSLVGPRPPLPREVRGYEGHVFRRLYIKPGLTGMWQVNGRSDLGWEDSVRLDLYYVENWSLVGDLIILWRTLKVLLRPVGAY